MSNTDGNALALSGMYDVLQRNNTIAVAAWGYYIQTHYQTSISAIANTVADYMTATKGTTFCN